MENIDELIKWKKIDQLHNATLNFSKNSLEIKKLLFVVVGISTPLIINMCGNKLDMSLFVTLYIILGAFWIFDSYTYYYQKKLRNEMDNIFNTFTNEKASFEQISNCKLIRMSLFNMSQFCFYGIWAIIVTIVWLLYRCKIIA